MQANRVSTNSFLVLAAEVIDLIMRFALVIFTARLLGDESFGKISFAIAFTSLFLILSDLGLNHLLIREIARGPARVKELIGSGLVIKLILAAATFILIFMAAQFTNKPTNVLHAVYIMGAALIVGSFGDFFTTVFQGFQRMKYEAVASFTMSTSNTLIGVVILYLGGGVVALSWVYLISRLLRLAYCIASVGFKFTPIQLVYDKTLIKYFLKEGTGFAVTRFFSMIYTYVDTTLLSLMVGDAAVGWYNAAYRLIFAMMVFPMAVTRAVYPALASYYTSNLEQFRNLFTKTFKLLFVAGTLLATFLSILSQKIIVTLFGQEYINAALPLSILAWSTAIYSIGTVMTHTTRACGRQNYTAKVVGASAVINLVANLVLIPKYSYVGAAFATMMSEFITFTFHLGYVNRKIVNVAFLKLLPKIIVINLGTAATLRLLIDFNLFISCGLALPISVGLVLVTRIFSKEELAALQDTIKSVKAFRR
ncbi:MAG TPA: flippase [bacterium]